MLQYVAFKKSFRCFEARTLLLFLDGVNLLVGDQGCGKSTLIEMMRTLTTASNPEMQKRNFRSIGMKPADVAATISLAVDPPMRTMGYDFERDSPRMAVELQFHDMARQLASFHESHGQTSKPFLDSLGDVKEPVICFLDEPDQALSPRSCYDLVRTFRKLADKGCQIIAAVHNPIVIRGIIPGDGLPSAWNNVMDLEQRGLLISPDAYLEAQAQPRKTETKKATKTPRD
jgi:predicted ATPase